MAELDNVRSLMTSIETGKSKSKRGSLVNQLIKSVHKWRKELLKNYDKDSIEYLSELESVGGKLGALTMNIEVKCNDTNNALILARNLRDELSDSGKMRALFEISLKRLENQYKKQKKKKTFTTTIIICSIVIALFATGVYFIMKYSESIGIEYSTFDTTATEDVKNKYEELIAMKTELDEMDTQLGKKLDELNSMESQLKAAEEDLDYLQKQYMKTGSESDKALFEEYYSEYETHFEEFQSKVNEYNAFYELFQKKVEEYNIKANIFNGNN